MSFADLLAIDYGVIAVKEALSGTTLADTGEGSYLARLKKALSGPRPDLFVCQVSTNDAARGVPPGSVRPALTGEGFDASTTAGAMETALRLVREAWGCPAVFYTQPRYDSPAYAALVKLTEEISQKWGIDVIDLWNDPAFARLAPGARERFMADAIHPTAAGYRELWLPVFARALDGILARAEQK